jgi:hypothetical protein
MSGCSSDEKPASQTTTVQNSAKVIPSLTDAEKEAVMWLLGGPKETELVKPENTKKVATLTAMNEEAIRKYLTDCDVKKNLICGATDEEILKDWGTTAEDLKSASLDLKKDIRQDMAALLASTLKLMSIAATLPEKKKSHREEIPRWTGRGEKKGTKLHIKCLRQGDPNVNHLHDILYGSVLMFLSLLRRYAIVIPLGHNRIGFEQPEWMLQGE